MAQRKQKCEYRELLGTLSQSAHCFADNSPELLFETTAVSHEQNCKAQDAHSNAQRCIEDRLFIAKRIKRANILEHWQLLAAKKDWSSFWSEWRTLHATLLELADKDLEM